jgi:hypothetical protein
MVFLVYVFGLNGDINLNMEQQQLIYNGFSMSSSRSVEMAREQGQFIWPRSIWFHFMTVRVGVEL